MESRYGEIGPMSARSQVDMKAVLRSIGAGTCRARKRLGFTQEDAAHLLHLSLEYYGCVDRGRKAPSLDTLCGIAVHLNVSADELLGIKPPAEEWTPPEWPIPANTLALQKLPPEQRRLFRRLIRCSPETLDMAIEVLDRLHALTTAAAVSPESSR